ncbi:SDR family oxidoreductase [Aeromicrobium senzhongii]|uniref:SDR family oxidoreductase n=1 Tax=Aeromicrobium senzhongii TaxID=2663859 RepID=A0ABX6SUS7_9ACTN|nr:SDR family oxidoreductase [Aeromicrobium senzhongii]MTB87971.1 SDR family NAD(P)-dependent oxidoreductase [Aeromicrobium senzhongii]QNL95017.1 SDR family oxidoreductase [Aeromicrobium senzhongii]
MTYFTQKIAVVTGAGSGIGRALALELVGRGARVAICDVDAAGLAETEQLIRAAGGEVRSDHLDVTERERVLAYAAEVADHFGAVHQIYNNAGIAFTGDIEATDFKHLERVMDVDYWGVVNGTKAFLPHLIASGDGHVVNISSVFGIISVPTQGAYNAAKFAVRGFTEALSMEMASRGRPVKVTCVHPGGIKTNVARNAGQVDGLDHDGLATTFDRIARTSPARAAEVILDGVQKGRTRVLIGADARVIDLVARVAGPHYQRLVGRLAGKAGL